MKIIDFEKRGNLVRLYLGSDSVDDYWGDDWDDAPYEYNAGKVYDKYISAYIDLAFDWKYYIYEQSEISFEELSKEDFKNGFPFLTIKDKDDKVLLEIKFGQVFSGSVLVSIVNGNGNGNDLLLTNEDTGDKVISKVMDVRIY